MSAASALRSNETDIDSLPEAAFGLACPRCRKEPMQAPSARAASLCRTCGFEARETAGFPDFRMASDRYLSLNQESRKATKLAVHEAFETLEGLSRRYYRMTADVSRAREERFVRHILDAKSRGHALLARLSSEGPILDVGCGTGGFVAAAAESGRQAVGIDIAARWLVVARKRLSPSIGSGHPHSLRHGRGKVWLIAGCAENLPFADDSFPVIVADSLLEHVANPAQAMSEMIRVLRPGGTLVVWFPNRRWPGPDPHVGLSGLPLLPRRLAERYVLFRRGPIFWPRCGTGGEWAKLARTLDQRVEVRITAADLSAWPREDRSLRARSARSLGLMSRMHGIGPTLKVLGPIGELAIRKPEAAGSAAKGRSKPSGSAR